ncbi:MAG TPA: hypothetical protein VHG27_10145 [Xanthobacteraceae bacterium]|nr:hypothetical protein [Xanthobacteraceae bacterium]
MLVTVSNYFLPENVEHGTVHSVAGLTLFGNAAANHLTGNTGADTLDGLAGGDRLAGGEGNDTFVLRRGETNGDVLADFNGNGALAGDMVRRLSHPHRRDALDDPLGRRGDARAVHGLDRRRNSRQRFLFRVIVL